jgi:hypothetical protein
LIRIGIKQNSLDPVRIIKVQARKKNYEEEKTNHIYPDPAEFNLNIKLYDENTPGGQ